MLALERRLGFEVIEDDGEGEPVLLAVQRLHVGVVVADLDATEPSALTLAGELTQASPPVPLVVVMQPAQPERGKAGAACRRQGMCRRGAGGLMISTWRCGLRCAASLRVGRTWRHS